MTERDKIVAWLKREGHRPIVPGSLRGPEALLMAAVAIERGDHMIRPEPTIPAETWMKISNLGH